MHPYYRIIDFYNSTYPLSTDTNPNYPLTGSADTQLTAPFGKIPVNYNPNNLLKPKDNAIFAQNTATHSFLILQTNQMITRDLIKISSKTEEDIIFQYGITPRSESNAIKEQISQGLKSISELEKESLKTIETLNEEIDCLTNHADTTDYIFSACSGILCGLIDFFLLVRFL